MTTDSRRPKQRYAQVAEGVRVPGNASLPDAALNLPSAHQRRHQVHAAETRLLYENSSTGIIASLFIALAFVSVQRHASSPSLIATWLLYVLVIAGTRFVIAR